MISPLNKIFYKDDDDNIKLTDAASEKFLIGFGFILGLAFSLLF